MDTPCHDHTDMKTIKLTINGKIFECGDCVHLAILPEAPSCQLGIDPMNCAECDKGIPRPQPVPRPVPSLPARAMSWAKAEASALVSSISEEQVQARISACMTCEYRRPGDPVGHCTKCGCGDSPAAELSRKARLPSSTCPQGRWPS